VATTADISVETPAGRVAVELKAPHELNGNDEIRTKSAARVAEDVLGRSGKQRRTAASSFLVVAGYRVPDGPHGALMENLLSRLARRPTVAGVAVLSIGNHPAEDAAVAASYLGDRWPRAFTPEQTTAMLALVIATNVGRNSNYHGPVPVVGLNDSDGLKLPSGSAMVRWRSDGVPEVIDGSMTGDS
jgi:hypothetical protein